MGHRPPPRARGSSPFVCVSAGLVRGCGRDKRAAQRGASEKPGQVCRGPDSRGPQNTTQSGRWKKKPEIASEPRLLRRDVRPESPPSPAPAPALTDVSIIIVVLLQLHVQQDVPSHHLHVAPRPTLGSSRLHSAPLGCGCKLRSALSAQPGCTPPALCFTGRSAATEHAQRDAATPAPDQTAPCSGSRGGSQDGGRGGAGAGCAGLRLRSAL